MKILVVFVVAVAAVVSVAAAKEAGVFNSNLPVSLAAPNALLQTRTASGWPLRPGHWTNRATVTLRVAPNASHPNLRLQVELVRNGAQPSGRATATQPRPSAHPSLTLRGLVDGTYRWWARFYDGSAVSPWVSFSPNTAFGVDTSRPSTPAVSSATDPVQGKVYRSGKVDFSWSSTDAGSGVAGYSYNIRSPGGSAAYARHVMRTSLSLTNLSSGTYTLWVRARDRAGNWSKPSTYRIRLDSTAPTVTSAGFSTFAFNPHYTSMTLNYAINLPSWVHIGVYRQSDNRLVRFVVRRATRKNQILHYTWHGRDNRGRIVAPGAYNFVVRTTDAYGNTSVKEYSDLSVLDKVIIVSLSQQRLWAYDGRHQLLTSLVTTGNPILPTPRGTFTILAKWHPFTFISPFPRTAWDYYPPSPVQYAMLFRTGGYYIHDAPWRSLFGPGTNSQAGDPGSTYTGTHGCVNVPANVAYELFQWAPDGTPVRVVR